MHFVKKLTCCNIVLFFTLHCSSLVYSDSKSYDDTLNSFDAVINHIQERVGLSEESAIVLYQHINMFAEGIQTAITYIAQSSDDYDTKEKKIRYTISKYFDSPESTVQVSSLSRSTIFDYSIHTYLYRLARLRSRYHYTKVELIFEPDYLGISSFKKIGESKYELSVSMWQEFIGYIGDSIAYSDATRKKFLLYFEFDERRRFTIKIGQILVAETINLDYYRKYRRH